MARVGIIGTGWGARVQIPAFRSAGLEIAGIAGFHKSKTARVAEELGVRPFEDWRALITSDVDCVSIVTPPDHHLEMASAALQGGKHVISEKPTALDTSQAEQLLRVARQYPDRIAIIDHELRFLPAWREIRPRMGEIGALRYVEVRYASPSRGDRNREWNWWSDADRGGGVWGAVGSHYVDALRYFGLEVRAAQGVMQTTIAERPFGGEKRRVTSDDLSLVQLRLAGGAVATMTFSAVASGPDEPCVMTFHGESGSFRFIGEEILHSARASAYRRVAGGELQNLPGNSPGGAFGTGTVYLARALRSALEGDRSALSPAATFEDGLVQQRVLDAARSSHGAEGRWVTV